jgi:N-acetylglutamate synthase-like GNAT family acetyltransferase
LAALRQRDRCLDIVHLNPKDKVWCHSNETKFPAAAAPGTANRGPAMSKFSIRAAIVLELAALEALQWRASLRNINDRAALLANADAILLPAQQILDGQVFVAEQAKQIKGFSAVVPRIDGDFELDGLFVEPECWRKGIGRALVHHASEVASMSGAKHLHVVGNPHAAHFYTACGFEVIGVAETRFGSGLLMRKAFGSSPL